MHAFVDVCILPVGPVAIRTQATPVEASMNPQLQILTFEVTVEPGQRLALPEEAVQELGAGRWLVSIQRSESLERSTESGVKAVVRDHGAFLKSYADEDESLYDDCKAG